jgi:formylglycine-generating enzyme required for sulfatase activity
LSAHETPENIEILRIDRGSLDATVEGVNHTLTLALVTFALAGCAPEPLARAPEMSAREAGASVWEHPQKPSVDIDAIARATGDASLAKDASDVSDAHDHDAGEEHDAVYDRDASDEDRGESALPTDGRCDRRVSRSCASPAAAGCGVVDVEGGTFTMGDTEAAYASPVRPSVTVGSFALDRYEVTVGRFRRFWEAGHPVPASEVEYPGEVAVPWDGEVTEPPRGGDRRCNWTPTALASESQPINCVNWYTAQAFCVWDGGRLPTEAEWERAARGSDGRAWVWGHEPREADICWMGFLTMPHGTCRVDDDTWRIDRSPFGAIQMAGNVTEWTADSWGFYGERLAGSNDPVAVVPGRGAHVTRGGSWDDNVAFALRAASRAAHEDRADETCLGFRCAY